MDKIVITISTINIIFPIVFLRLFIHILSYLTTILFLINENINIISSDKNIKIMPSEYDGREFMHNDTSAVILNHSIIVNKTSYWYAGCSSSNIQ